MRNVAFVTGKAHGTNTPRAGEAARRVERPALLARRFRFVERLFLVGGLGLFCFLIYKLDATAVLENLRIVGWGIVVILIQEILAYLANTAGWYAAFPKPRPSVPASRLLAARIGGDAVNYVTPTANLGGEFIRARMLRDVAEPTVLVASVAVAKLTQVMAQLAFIAVGLSVILDDIPLPPALSRGLFIGLAALLGLVVVLFLAQQRGMFEPLGRLVDRLGMSAWFPDFTPHLKRLDDEIARFHLDSSGALLASAGWFFVGWTMGVVEIYLILWFMNVPVDLYRAFTIEVLSVAIDGVLFFVPAKLGTQEAGKVLVFVTLGLDPTKGLSLGILRRIRELSWTLVGLLLVSRGQAWQTPRAANEADPRP